MEGSEIQFVERERLILKRALEIGRASSKLLQVEEIAKQICTRLISEHGYDFVSVQLVNVVERTIESVYGTRRGGEWYNIGGHSLEGDQKFLDIQAYVAASYDPPMIELITGWDDRFDKFIYEKFGHRNFVRAFVPLIVVRDAQGSLTKADPDQFGFEPVGYELNRSIRMRSGLGSRPHRRFVHASADWASVPSGPANPSSCVTLGKPMCQKR